MTQRSTACGYDLADDRQRAPDRRRRAGLPVRRVRGRSRRARPGSRSPPSLLRRAPAGAAGARPPGGVLPRVGIPGLPHVPGLGTSRGRGRTPGAPGRPACRGTSRRSAGRCRRSGREPRHAPGGTEIPPPIPPRRNPPRSWAAPPPWSGEERGSPGRGRARGPCRPGHGPRGLRMGCRIPRPRRQRRRASRRAGPGRGTAAGAPGPLRCRARSRVRGRRRGRRRRPGGPGVPARRAEPGRREAAWPPRRPSGGPQRRSGSSACPRPRRVAGVTSRPGPSPPGGRGRRAVRAGMGASAPLRGVPVAADPDGPAELPGLSGVGVAVVALVLAAVVLFFVGPDAARPGRQPGRARRRRLLGQPPRWNPRPRPRRRPYRLPRRRSTSSRRTT